MVSKTRSTRISFILWPIFLKLSTRYRNFHRKHQVIFCTFRYFLCFMYTIHKPSLFLINIVWIIIPCIYVHHKLFYVSSLEMGYKMMGRCFINVKSMGFIGIIGSSERYPLLNTGIQMVGVKNNKCSKPYNLFWHGLFWNNREQFIVYWYREKYTRTLNCKGSLKLSTERNETLT